MVWASAERSSLRTIELDKEHEEKLERQSQSINFIHLIAPQRHLLQENVIKLHQQNSTSADNLK